MAGIAQAIATAKRLKKVYNGNRKKVGKGINQTKGLVNSAAKAGYIPKSAAKKYGQAGAFLSKK